MFAEWLWPTLTAIGFAVIGFFIHALVVRVRDVAANRAAGDILRDAQRDAEVLRKEAQLATRDELMRIRERAEEELRERQRVLSATAERLSSRDERLEREEQRCEERALALDVRSAQLEADRSALDLQQDRLTRLVEEEHVRLSELAEMTSAQARERLLLRLEEDMAEERSVFLRKAQEDARVTAEVQAREIILGAIQRYAADQVSEASTTPVLLPGEEMKGRIIGREGRNIRALEMATGVTVIIDDSPEVVVLSSFDPVRREIAKVTLERLMEDGRINPARIEEMADKVTAELDDLILQAGEEAVEALHLPRVPLEVLRMLGKLKFRTSYSQNVLTHSVEAARLAGMMAGELGLDVETARRAALFHDIGKAADPEAEGTGHADIGARLLKKAGENDTIVHAVAAHHGEDGTLDAYASLISAADALTASRPGARTETTNLFLKRMENLEAIAKAEPGVLRSLAMQAGRELRIFVEPTEVDDAMAIQLARRIAQRVEEKLDYPGQIKVTVIRMTRCVEYAR
ncbi:MAG: ribonuclease Y [Verrucomicrobiota bacterium]|jgi:ribonuclease Y|nr:ribonuclease Y [Verrucomicrobiota bacterium]